MIKIFGKIKIKNLMRGAQNLKTTGHLVRLKKIKIHFKISHELPNKI